MKAKSLSIVATLTLAIMTLSASSLAQPYPNRPIRILTSTPGGGNDFLARIVAPALSDGLGESVIVDNRASRLVGPLGAQAEPDGYTLVIAGSTFQFVPLLQKQDYDPIKSFAAISQLERSPNILVVNTALGVNSVKELIAMAKAKPGKLLYGSGGTGGSLHLAAEMLKMRTGINIVRVPYKSTGPALIGLLSQEVHLVFSTPGGALPHVKSGKFRALAVTSPEPSPLVPGVPTMASQGLPGFELETIGFILAPAGTPVQIIRHLNREIVEIMSEPDVKEKLLAGGSEAVSSTPEQLTAKMKADDAKMRKLFKSLGLSAKK